MEDFEHSLALWSDPEVLQYISATPATREEAWSRLLRYSGHWQMAGYGYWVVCDKHSGLFLGEVGFADYKRRMTPSIEGRPEAGWVFTTAARGKGYALEAVRCMLTWSDRHLDAETSVCIITPEHHASIKLALKAGFSAVTNAEYKDSVVTLLERHRQLDNTI